MVTHSSFDGCLDCLKFLTIMHKAVINICSKKSILAKVPWAFENNVDPAIVG